MQLLQIVSEATDKVLPLFIIFVGVFLIALYYLTRLYEELRWRKLPPYLKLFLSHCEK